MIVHLLTNPKTNDPEFSETMCGHKITNFILVEGVKDGDVCGDCLNKVYVPGHYRCVVLEH